MLKIRRVLISVWEKKGIVELARKLREFNAEIISTGKTATLLRENGIAVKEVASLTSFPEILSGRVKTLHPKVFGGILANKKNPLHMEEIARLKIEPIDMVVIDLYPFAQKLEEDLTIDEMIEYIDVGGPSLIRAAAKNFKNVACLSNLKQYPQIIAELDKNHGFIGEDALVDLARVAFHVTKEYDNVINNYFQGQEILTLDLKKTQELRYGENSHQKAVLYEGLDQKGLGFRQLQGKELSYNNFLDLDTAIYMVKEFNEPAAAIVKHASLCGVGVDKRLASAYKKAYAVDPISSFGGIIGLNKKVDKDTAKQIAKSGFHECIIAPCFCREALKIFSAKKNLRIIEADLLNFSDGRDIRTVAFGYLIQDKDVLTVDKNALKVVSKKKPSAKQMKDLLFAWKVCKFVKSNAIVVAKNFNIFGIGGGRPSRVGSVEIALRQAGPKSQGSCLASDGFFPKDDSIRVACKKGIKAIIQPGGSLKDNEIIKLCDKLGMAMVFTGIRHFRH